MGGVQIKIRQELTITEVEPWVDSSLYSSLSFFLYMFKIFRPKKALKEGLPEDTDTT